MNRKVLAVPYAVWILGFIIIPLCFIFGRAFTTAEGAFTLSNIFAIVDPLHRKALVLSLELAFLCTTICIILAYPLALIVRNSKMKSSGVIMLILIMPMWMNSILRILALQMILSNNGILNFVLTSLGLQPLQIINTKGAIVLGMVYDFADHELYSGNSTRLCGSGKRSGSKQISDFLAHYLPTVFARGWQRYHHGVCAFHDSVRDLQCSGRRKDSAAG